MSGGNGHTVQAAEAQIIASVQGALSSTVAVGQQEVLSTICDRRDEALNLFEGLSSDQREQLASDAWTIGLRALRNAYTQAEESRLQDIGKTLLGDLDRQLRTHIEAQQTGVKQLLASYFDPRDGQVTERLRAFVDDQGVLAKLLREHLAPENSVLAATLASQVGENSPLFRKLSPTDSEGLIQVLEQKIVEALDHSQSEVANALDPLHKDSAVGRFLAQLRQELDAAEKDRKDQLSTAMAALDANNEDSLLSRLIRESDMARRALLQAVNPELPDSPMAVVKGTLTSMLAEHIRSQQEAAEQQRTRQERLEKDILEALARIETRRAQDKKSTRGGFDFEAAVIDFISSAVQGAPVVAEPTGNTTGKIAKCKVGDLVLRFIAESAFVGSGVVVEAKRDSSYNVAKANAELETARQNRDADVGLFVMAASHAPAGFPGFARYGSNILVVWDAEDPSADAYLHAAVQCALGLATRHKSKGSDGDLVALADIQRRIENELTRLEKVRKHNERIRSSSDEISEELRKGKDKLDLMLRKAKAALEALNIEVQEEEVERESPIGLDADSLQKASDAVGGSDDDK